VFRVLLVGKSAEGPEHQHFSEGFFKRRVRAVAPILCVARVLCLRTTVSGGFVLVARDRSRLPIATAYSAFVLVGLSAGVGGVLLPAQMQDYGVDRARIGIIFFAFSAGFMLAGSSAGALIHRLGTRTALAVGSGTFALAAFTMAARPAFPALLAVQVLAGYGIGVLESVLNAYLTQLPRAARRVNRLHAFFGVGALLGPLLAAWILRWASWTRVWLVLAVVGVVLLAAVLLVFPKPGVPMAASARRGLLAATVRERTVLLGALFLAIYVGLEISVGNWGFSFLVDGRGQSQLLAGYALSGYWLGLTAGRFLISPAASKAGLSDTAMTFLCVAGVVAAAGLVWLTSAPALVGAGFVLLGFFLGPIFPTTMAITPSLAADRLVPTAIGFINGVSVVGGSVLPWLAGTIGQTAGVSTLPPFALALAALLLLIWWRIARRIAGGVPPQ
jgi:fucose permease